MTAPAPNVAAEADDAPDAAPAPASPERFCPNCGQPLVELRCKLLCPDRSCGYYMSCSDFY